MASIHLTCLHSSKLFEDLYVLQEEHNLNNKMFAQLFSWNLEPAMSNSS